VERQVSVRGVLRQLRNRDAFANGGHARKRLPAATDDGHLATNLAWPIASPGVPDEDAIDDFADRAVHTVVRDGEQFTLRYYAAETCSHAYDEGSSDGGREDRVEANRYPDDFDGMLAGDPYFDVTGHNIIISNVTVQLNLRAAQIRLRC
jgi:feruloyl esterase